MEPIIRAAAVAKAPRQLLRPVASGLGTETPPAKRPAAPETRTPNASQNATPSASPSAAASASAAQPSESAAAYERALNKLAGEQQQQQSAQQFKLQQQNEAELVQAKLAAERLGYAEGLAQGEQAAQANLAQHLARLNGLMQQLHQARTEVLAGAEDLMVEIAYTAVCRLVGAGIGQRASVLATLQQVLSELRQHEPLVIYLHPQDLAWVAPAMAELGLNPEQTQLRADASIKMGGCLVETAVGTLDARLETQLSRLRDTLLQVRRGEEYAGETL